MRRTGSYTTQDSPIFNPIDKKQPKKHIWFLESVDFPDRNPGHPQNITFVCQVALLGSRDHVENGIRCVPAAKFLGSLV